MILVLLLAQIAVPQSPLPSFDQFPAGETFTGQPAKPILKTRRDRLFRTRIRDGAAIGPNFAGHYAIAIWGCGTACIQAVVVDSKDGSIRALPFSGLTFGYDLKYASGTNPADDVDFEPLLFNLKSRLLVVRGCPEDKNCGTYYYELTGSQFRLIRRFDARQP